MKDIPWRVRYRVGVAMSKHLVPYASLDEVAKKFGLKGRQYAYNETILALGKVVYELQKIEGAKK